MTQDTAHMPLDERGLEAATYAICILLERGHATEADLARYGVHAYLQTAAADVSGLVDRLEKDEVYRDGSGYVTRKRGLIATEAASTLQTLSASNAALEAENARLREALSPFSVYFKTRAALSAPRGGQTWGEWERAQQEAGS